MTGLTVSLNETFVLLCCNNAFVHFSPDGAVSSHHVSFKEKIYIDDQMCTLLLVIYMYMGKTIKTPR